jgi:hypothetical protein
MPPDLHGDCHGIWCFFFAFGLKCVSLGRTGRALANTFVGRTQHSPLSLKFQNRMYHISSGQNKKYASREAPVQVIGAESCDAS